MKANTRYKPGDFVIGWFHNIIQLRKQITLESNEEGFETDFMIGGTNQNITIDSIQRKCTEEEIGEYKSKYK